MIAVLRNFSVEIKESYLQRPSIKSFSLTLDREYPVIALMESDIIDGYVLIVDDQKKLVCVPFSNVKVTHIEGS